MYPSNSYLDDLTMAAGWLARRTGEPAFLADAANYWKRMRSEEAGVSRREKFFVKFFLLLCPSTSSRSPAKEEKKLTLSFSFLSSSSLAQIIKNSTPTTIQAAYYYDESWQGCHSGASMLLAEITGEKQYSDAAHAHAEAWVQGGRPVYYTPAGLAFVSKWGSLRTMANNAFMVLLYAHSIRNTDPRASSRYSCWARNQLRYALGDAGRSFVVGMGNNPPKFVHHRSASCPDSTEPVGSNQPTCDFTQFNSQSPNPQILKGALAGGPDSNDWCVVGVFFFSKKRFHRKKKKPLTQFLAPFDYEKTRIRRYNDKRDDYVLNEVRESFFSLFLRKESKKKNEKKNSPCSILSLFSLFQKKKLKN